ncbi:MAG TPA: transporter [Cyclobacteriaceae bacterium]
MSSRVVADFDSYYYVAENKFYAIRAGFNYGMRNERHLFGIAVPFVHSIFSGDYAGYENTTGIGDLRFTYIGVPYKSNDPLGLSRVSFALEVTAPTGDENLGRGVGTWLYRPGLVFGVNPSPNFSLYPEVRFQFSGKEANSQGGGDGNPDVEDPEDDEKLQILAFALPATYAMDKWNGWISLNTEYAYSFTEETYFLFMRLDLGKMMGDNSSAALQITRFIAGQPRLETLIRVRFNFFLRKQ